jgi:hypothetical protein
MSRPSNPYLDFGEYPSESGKTKVVSVYNRSGGYELGQIRWHGPWRQYCFFPADDCIFNVGCLSTVQEYIESLMEDRKCVT